MQKIFDWMMKFLYEFVSIAVGWLPESPFSEVVVELTPFHKVMSWINYFVPVGTMLAILTTYLAAVFAWYGVRWILRLAKYID